jgi:hypothetical protein
MSAALTGLTAIFTAAASATGAVADEKGKDFAAVESLDRIRTRVGCHLHEQRQTQTGKEGSHRSFPRAEGTAITIDRMRNWFTEGVSRQGQ